MYCHCVYLRKNKWLFCLRNWNFGEKIPTTKLEFKSSSRAVRQDRVKFWHLRKIPRFGLIKISFKAWFCQSFVNIKIDVLGTSFSKKDSILGDLGNIWVAFRKKNWSHCSEVCRRWRRIVVCWGRCYIHKFSAIFCQFSAKKLAFFSKKQCYHQFLFQN
jgi:hypothetical protein